VKLNKEESPVKISPVIDPETETLGVAFNIDF